MKSHRIYLYKIAFCLAFLIFSEIYRQNLFAQQVTIVKDICIGYCSSDVTNLTVFNGKLYFAAYNRSSLWVYNGGGEPKIAINQKLVPLIEFQNKLICKSYDNGGELWAYDGINAPVLIKNIKTSDGSIAYNLAVFNNKLYFSVRDAAHGNELWVYDGSNEPSLMKDIFLGSKSSNPSYLTVFKNKLYFAADDGIHGSEMWVYDGFTEPELFKDFDTINSNGSMPSCFTVFNDSLYFSVQDVDYRPILWVYDGSNDPIKVKAMLDVNMGIAGYLTVFNNQLFFCGADEINGVELWAYDGINKISIVKDIYPGAYSSSPMRLIVYDNKLLFNARDGDHGNELWCYDGINDPMMLKDIWTGTNGSDPNFLTVFNNKLYFSATELNYGWELWSYSTSNANEISESVCDSYTSPSGKVWTISGTYHDTIPKAEGGDSILIIHLTVNNSQIGDTSASACEIYSWYGTDYSASGEYTHMLMTQCGCDSLVTMHLTINKNTESTITETLPNGEIYTAQDGRIFNFDTTFYMVIPNSHGCDSSITVHLSFIIDAAPQKYLNGTIVYPNPVKDNLTIKFSQPGNYSVRVYNILGTLVSQVNLNNSEAYTFDMNYLPSGNYLLRIDNDQYTGLVNVLKE